jgi:hypothetical protein
MRTGAIQALLLRTKWRFVRHKDNRDESMIHKHERLGACV